MTMLDVLQDEQELEEDANAVLGAADDKNCTYDQGYLTRQALYACVSCSVPASPDYQPAGVCLACSYHCHEGHELVELYTKRLFRCDCGTARLQAAPCKLRPGKSENSENKYNQNFSGVYCTCSRPYPDPEDSRPDQMIQCVVCEDWYHGRHLGLERGPPKDSSYAEMICLGCTELHPLLSAYRGLSVTAVEPATPDTSLQLLDVSSRSVDSPLTTEVPGSAATTTEDDRSAASSEVAAATAAGVQGQEGQCFLKIFQSSNQLTPGTLFLPDGWRSELCRCPECLQTYQASGLAFLTDSTDTVHHYESQGKTSKGQFEQGMEALSQMDRIKQVEAISMYNSMKENLMAYLAKFAQNGKVVREADIKEFFEGMKANKKMRLDLPPPDNCK